MKTIRIASSFALYLQICMEFRACERGCEKNVIYWNVRIAEIREAL